MKVYFNGSCNICNAEISHYKKKTFNINYVDISKNKDEHINHLSKKDLFRRMHVYHDGKIVSGSESFLGFMGYNSKMEIPVFIVEATII